MGRLLLAYLCYYRVLLMREFRNLRSTEYTEFKPTAINDIHARVYNLGTRYLIEPLRELRMDYLHRELTDAASLSAKDIVQILDDVYTYTSKYEPRTTTSLCYVATRYAPAFWTGCHSIVLLSISLRCNPRLPSISFRFSPSEWVLSMLKHFKCAYMNSNNTNRKLRGLRERNWKTSKQNVSLYVSF